MKTLEKEDFCKVSNFIFKLGIILYFFIFLFHTLENFSCEACRRKDVPAGCTHSSRTCLVKGLQEVDVYGRYTHDTNTNLPVLYK